MTLIDERFLTHRLRSSSTAGIAGGVFAGLLWFYRYLVDHRIEWDLFAVLFMIAVVKMGLMVYYRLTD
jgi:hypothetical protein